MATGTRLQPVFEFGTLGASLTAGDGTITFASAPGFATLTGDEYVAISIPPTDTRDGEVVHLTAFTAGATTGSIERGQEGTTAAIHDSGDEWNCGPTPRDANAAVWGFACSDLTTAITTGTSQGFAPLPRGMEVERISAYVLTAGTGSAATVDVNDDGASILSTKLTIAASANEDDGTAVLSSTTLAAGSQITADVDAVGTGMAGLVVCLIGYWL